MKKEISALLISALLLWNGAVLQNAVYLPKNDVSAAAEEELPEFDIKNGVLLSYNGRDSEVHVPEGVTEIAADAFRRIEYFAKKTDQKEKIWFRMNSTVEKLYLPESLRIIRKNAFSDMTGLREVHLQEGVEEIGACAFRINPEILEDANSLTGWTEAERQAVFAPHLTKLELPDSVRTIGDKAFQNTALKSVRLPASLETIGASAFEGSSVTSVEIPAGVTEIADAAFLNMPLESVVIPESVTSIGNMAFANTALTSVRLPEHLQKLGVGAFMGTPLTEVNLPAGMTEIPEGAFQNTKLKAIEIPDGVTKIGARAFQASALERLVLPDSVTAVGAYAFSGTKIAEMNLPASLTEAESTSFSGTPYLDALTEQNGGWLILSNGKLLNYVGRDVHAVIPESVTEIVAGAFTRCARLRTLTVPDSVKTVAEKAVVSCDLQSVYSQNPAAEKLSEHVLDAPVIPPQKGKIVLDLKKDTWTFANTAEVFGDSFSMTDAAKALLTEQLGSHADLSRKWDGSCYGLSLTVLLAKYGLLAPAQIQAGAGALSEIKPEQAVQSVINYYQFMQESDAALKIRAQGADLADSYFEKMIALGWQAENEGKPFLIMYATPTDSHVVVGCGIESGSWKWDGRTYDRRIPVWDPNCPDQIYDEACLYYRNADYACCVPQSKMRYEFGGKSNSGRITAVTDAIAQLGSPAYPFAALKQGDLNGDGKCSIADAVLLSKYLLTAENLPAAALRAADLNGDKTVNAADLSLLKRQVLAAAK
ncbi:MAG: leucine-rich repeat protein [Oscillospiraceae bacterium]|nr:leucine-rich repeat protein [Oscillospiraceae bacterium]